MNNHIYPGAEWIGNVPNHWKFYKGKYIFGESNDKGNNINLELLSPTQKYGVIPQTLYEQYTTLRTVKVKEDTDLNTFKTVHKGNFCISLRSFQGGFEYSEYEGVVSPAYHILYSKLSICDGYYKYLFKEQSFIAEMNSYCQTLRDGKNISFNDFGKTLIPYPPINEQQAIANYLDDRCSKIDAIIAESKASIEEYKELKQAVITQAVTLGIKKNRPLKDTHILWIGKMPCGWQLAELKFFASIKSGITLGQKYPAGAKLVEMPYLRVANVQGEYVDLSDVKTIQVLPEEVDKYRLEAGVVLMTEGGDRDKLGRGCVWHEEITPCLHQNHIFALTTKSDKLLPEYFSHVTTSEVARCYFDYTAKKTTNLANTNSSTIMNFRLPIPPLEEQREIVQYLDKRIKTLNDMISEKQSLIEDLESYKKSLIYEVVTGKRKVVA